MHRRELLMLFYKYQTIFMDEAAYLSRSIDFVENHAECFHRHLWPTHVTGSAWVVSPNHDRVLMLHHKKLDQWFQPGGHADGHADILAVALRETAEESGFDESNIRLVDEDIFDIDIHNIPAIGDEPPHSHIDIRFLVEIDDTLPVVGNDESHQVLWVNLSHVSRYNNSRSTYRMVEKTRRLRHMEFNRAIS